MNSDNFKGGFSDLVFSTFSSPVQDALNAGKPVPGWIGYSGRTLETDRFIESKLIQLGVKDHEVYKWLLSKDAEELTRTMNPALSDPSKNRRVAKHLDLFDLNSLT